MGLVEIPAACPEAPMKILIDNYVWSEAYAVPVLYWAYSACTEEPTRIHLHSTGIRLLLGAGPRKPTLSLPEPLDCTYVQPEYIQQHLRFDADRLHYSIAADELQVPGTSTLR